MRFKKVHLNFLIDGGALLAFILLIATGFLISFRLPPGTGGRHGGGGLALLGWTRHQWGDFHFWVALVLIALILIHLLLHWRWVWAMITGPAKPSPGGTGWSGFNRRTRIALASVFAIFLLATLIVPWLLPVTERALGR